MNILRAHVHAICEIEGIKVEYLPYLEQVTEHNYKQSICKSGIVFDRRAYLLDKEERIISKRILLLPIKTDIDYYAAMHEIGHSENPHLERFINPTYLFLLCYTKTTH